MVAVREQTPVGEESLLFKQERVGGKMGRGRPGTRPGKRGSCSHKHTAQLERQGSL